MVPANVVEHRVGYRYVQFAALQAFADSGRRYRQFQRVQTVNLRALGYVKSPARTADDDELHERHQFLPTVPASDLGKRVGANQEEQPRGVAKVLASQHG